MKRKFLVAAVAAVVAAGAAWGINQKTNHDALSDLTLSNVEALAQESGDSLRTYCCGDGVCFTIGSVVIVGYPQLSPC